MDMHLGGAGHQAAPSSLSPAPEHSVALISVLCLLVSLVVAAALLNHFAGRSRLVAAVAGRIRAASPGVNLAVLLMLLTADIHLALIPAHVADPARALLFLLDGVAFIGVCGLAYAGRSWLASATVLLVATIGAYVFYLGTGREDADLIGVATKAIEVGALLAIARVALVGRGDPQGGQSRSQTQRPERRLQ